MNISTLQCLQKLQNAQPPTPLKKINNKQTNKKKLKIVNPLSLLAFCIYFNYLGYSFIPFDFFSFAAVIRVVTQRSSPLTATHSSSAFLSFCYWEPITCMYLLAAHQSYFLLHLPPKTRFPEYGSLLLIGQFEERNAELEWAAVSEKDMCVTTLCANKGCEGDYLTSNERDFILLHLFFTNSRVLTEIETDTITSICD